MGKGFLTALLLLLCSGGLRAAQPVMFEKAAGGWNGRVYSGPDRFDVSVALTKESSYSRGVFKATGMGNNQKNSEGEFFASRGEGACYAIKVRVAVKPPLTFDGTACPAGPEALTITAVLGSGKLAFSNKFTRCEFSFSGLVGRANGILYRVGREKAGPKAAEVKKDPKPQLPAPKFQMRKP